MRHTKGKGGNKKGVNLHDSSNTILKINQGVFSVSPYNGRVRALFTLLLEIEQWKS